MSKRIDELKMKLIYNLDEIREIVKVDDVVEERLSKLVEERQELIKKIDDAEYAENPEKFIETMYSDGDYEEYDVDFEVIDKDGNLNIEELEELLNDQANWDDDTGDEDNKFPFRCKVNGHIIQYKVKQGDCVEATWDNTIWATEIVDIKLIEE